VWIFVCLCGVCVRVCAYGSVCVCVYAFVRVYVCVSLGVAMRMFFRVFVCGVCLLSAWLSDQRLLMYKTVIFNNP
jgi:hypothetical protein